MTDEKWQQISALIESKFTVEEHNEEDLNPGHLEYYIFTGPLGRLKLERTIRPKLLDRKVYASKRIGGSSAEEMIYSNDEEVSFIKAYRWNEEVLTWSDIELNDLLN